jgi:hypothetical protein
MPIRPQKKEGKRLSELEELANRIEEQERTIELHSGPASVLILPRGGRVIGVDLGNGNLLWVNTRIEDVILNNEWNTGGIRTWVSPERAFFYDDPEKFEGWRCPRGIDPAKYEVAKKEKRAVELRSAISAEDMITKQALDGYLNKRIEIEQAERDKYAVHARLRIYDLLKVECFKSPFALWCLVQIPPGEDGLGTVTVPVSKNVQPVHYFNPIPDSYLQISGDRLEFIIDGQRELKVGVRPEDLANPNIAQLKYTFSKNKKHVNVTMVSRTGAKSQKECVDPAKSNPAGPRAVIQSYNSELTSSGLCFGELEIQGAAGETRQGGNLIAEDEVTIDFSLDLR